MQGNTREENPIVKIVFGILMIAGAIWLFSDISSQEARGGSIRLNVILMILYGIGGKWLISGVAAAVGIGVIVQGIRKKLA